jgi:hypothetical protein
MQYFTRKILGPIVVLFAYGTSCTALIFWYGLQCRDFIKLERGGGLSPQPLHTRTGRPINNTFWLCDNTLDVQKVDGPSAAHVPDSLCSCC